LWRKASWRNARVEVLIQGGIRFCGLRLSIGV
jgi:hypothetical protein